MGCLLALPYSDKMVHLIQIFYICSHYYTAQPLPLQLKILITLKQQFGILLCWYLYREKVCLKKPENDQYCVVSCFTVTDTHAQKSNEKSRECHNHNPQAAPNRDTLRHKL